MISRFQLPLCTSVLSTSPLGCLLLTGSAILWLQMQPALAQTAAPPLKPMPAQGEQWRAKWKQADLDNDGQLSKAEASAAGMKHVTERFDEVDANKDGKISDAELATWMKSRPRGAYAAGDKKPSPDTGGAGKAPEDAKAQGHTQDQNRGGSSGNGGNGGKEAGREGLMGYKTPEQRQAAMAERFAKADTNKDGGLSKAELQAAGNSRMLEYFDTIDTNKDGKLSPEEIRAAWERRKQ